jgi:hypothetical protein
MGFERGAFAALIRRPVLLLEAIKTWWAMRRRGSIRMAGPYVSWRRLTAYGDHLTTFSAQDVVNYLSWRRGIRAIRKWGWEA